MRILVGDIGGTNARFASMSVRDGGLELLAEATLPSRRFASLGEAAAEFFGRCPAARAPRHACFGLPGPVQGHERCEITNLPWVVDARELARALGAARVSLVNDVEAAAWGLGAIGPEATHTVWEGRPAAGGNLALVAPGTGLGEAALVWDGNRYHPYATEGGHADFAPADELEVGLWRFLRRRFEHVSWERAVSGPGLVAIHCYLLERRGLEPPGWLTGGPGEHDAAAAITTIAREDPASPCAEALDLFFELLGAETGNVALQTLATGGVYLAGGIVPKVLPELLASRFRERFVAKGRFRALLEAIPVRVVTDDRLALWGAAAWVAAAEGVTLEARASVGGLV